MMGPIKLFKQHPQGNQADEWGVQASFRQVLPAGQMVGDVIGARQWVCSDTDPLVHSEAVRCLSVAAEVSRVWRRLRPLRGTRRCSTVRTVADAKQTGGRTVPPRRPASTAVRARWTPARSHRQCPGHVAVIPGATRRPPQSGAPGIDSPRTECNLFAPRRGRHAAP